VGFALKMPLTVFRADGTPDFLREVAFFRSISRETCA
jgi:hypothetical protein